MMATEGHPFAEEASRRELPQLNTWRRGTLHYFALWLGLRGENLRINREEGFAVHCSRENKWWVFGPEGDWKEKLQQWLDRRYLERAKAGGEANA